LGRRIVQSKPTLHLGPGPRRCQSLLVTLAVVALAGCANVDYARPGDRIEPRAGQALVFGRIRFFYYGDGFLAIWIRPGDYALVGSAEKLRSMSSFREVVALLRVPADQVAVYVGDLIFTTRTKEGAQFRTSEFGATTVDVEPIQTARAALERRLAAHPPPPVSSPWCAGDDVPAFENPDLVSRARQLLDQGCPASR